MPRVPFIKKGIVILLLLGICIAWQSSAPSSVHESARKWILNELVAIKQQLKLAKPSNDIPRLKSLYIEARKHYKHIEFFIEYFSPREAKYSINGPLVNKYDREMGRIIFQPKGFQRMEELLFKDNDTVSFARECVELIDIFTSLEEYYKNIRLSDGILLEMCQLELVRICSMNLNGYDATISQAALTETNWCLEGIEWMVSAFQPYIKKKSDAENKLGKLLNKLSEAKRYINENQDYLSFNRLHFITKYVNPLNSLLVDFHQESGILWSGRKQALHLKERFLFGKESFNLLYFSMYYDDTLNLKKQAELGRLLFFDPILSGNNKRACASCHLPEKAFTDGLAKSIAIDNTLLTRNAPSLLNVAFQKAFFHDGRVYMLEEQVFEVVKNEKEMKSSLDEAVEKLKQSDEYSILFKKAFAGSNDTSITRYAIQKAIAEYEKTLVVLNSRFDNYLRGNDKSLTKREINGYNVFAGKALCGSCHFFPLFNGTIPPFFNESEFEIIGVPEDSTNKKLSPDPGRGAVAGMDEIRHSFKTPSVRNIELTAPYMHNGSYTRLDQVVDFYHKGGGIGLGYAVPNQTLPFDSLQLTSVEKEDIILFMKALTDTVGILSTPNTLPSFQGKAFPWNNRKIGGEY